VQSEQEPPNLPHVESLDCLHMLPSQQPFRHERRLHPPEPEPPPPEDPPDELPEALPDELEGCEHAPAWQVAPDIVQSEHALPPEPHAVSTMPTAQAPALSQHPLHDRPQVPPPSSPPLALPLLLAVLLPEVLPVPPLPLATPLLPGPSLPLDPGDESAALVAPSPFDPLKPVPL
jgi:hypothetical protein